MTARGLRAVVLAVCALGVAGMIAASIADAGRVALTFGLVTAGAVTCLMVATAVAAPSGPTAPVASGVEELARQLVDAGADASTVQDLIRAARGRAKR